MSLTLLLDLDDTLLVNDINAFLPFYLKAFAREVSATIDPDRFVTALMVGTGAMMKNRQPDCTLKEVFFSVFYPAIGTQSGRFDALADHFYAQVFPTLRSLTQPKPQAVALVDEALRRGYRLVVATNPLFPRTAVEQRLEWAGLPVERIPYDLVTTFETSHFTKESPAYFAEVLAQLAWPEGPLVMVGNDLTSDIAGARRLGLPAFWVSENGAKPPAGDLSPSASGTLAEVLPWLDSTPPDTLKPDYSDPAAMLATLRSTPAVLDTWTRNLPAAAWQSSSAPGEWSLTEILCHLRDVDGEVNLSRLQKVLAQDNPFIAGEDTDPWAQVRQYARQDGPQALGEFTAARLRLLELLESLEPAGWQRTARHSIFGPTRLVEMVQIIAGHDRLHIQQARRLLA